VGALGHYLEAEGVPTTQISLIREHTEAIRPPRALWVPFDMGRPLGVAGDAAFQRRVLLAALELLSLSEGPVLVDFPEDVPERPADLGQTAEGWACPVRFESAAGEEKDEEGPLSALRREITELRPWYDLGLERRERTSVAYFAPEVASEMLGRVASGEPLDRPETISSPAVALRLAAQDLKAFYFEAVTARPGFAFPEASEFNRWFWQETEAGRVLKVVKSTCLRAEDREMRRAGAFFLVPLDQA
jgi:hypothetical protein